MPSKRVCECCAKLHTASAHAYLHLVCLHLYFQSLLLLLFQRSVLNFTLLKKIKALLHCTVTNSGLIMYVKVSISAWIPVVWSGKIHALTPTCNQVQCCKIDHKEGKIFISVQVAQRHHGDRHGSDMLLSQTILGILFHICSLRLAKSALAFVSGSRSQRGPRLAPVLMGADTGSFN